MNAFLNSGTMWLDSLRVLLGLMHCCSESLPNLELYKGDNRIPRVHMVVWANLETSRLSNYSLDFLKCTSWLNLHTPPPKFSGLKQQIFIIVKFLWVRNLGVASCLPLAQDPVQWYNPVVGWRWGLDWSLNWGAFSFKLVVWLLTGFGSLWDAGLKTLVFCWLLARDLSQFFPEWASPYQLIKWQQASPRGCVRERPWFFLIT